MSDKHVLQKGIAAAVAPLALVVGMGAGNAYAAPGYVMATGKVMMNNYKECWKAKGGVDKKLAECGDMMEKPTPPPPAPMVEGDADHDGVVDSKDRCPDTRPGAKVDPYGCEIIPNVTVDLVNDEFAFDSAKLKPGMETALSDLSAGIMATPGTESLTIIGHTDSVGPEAYNMKLSVRRAQAVADFLAAKGIPRSTMTIEGRGESEPVADNSTKAGRAKNRRVEIKTH
jgi:outer membrane protein OmpA-like peptidoglycan-associated protein